MILFKYHGVQLVYVGRQGPDRTTGTLVRLDSDILQCLRELTMFSSDHSQISDYLKTRPKASN